MSAPVVAGPGDTGADDMLAARMHRLGLADLRARYLEQGEFVAIPDFLAADDVRVLVDEVERLRSKVHRSRVPGKQSVSVGWFTLRADAPAISALYHSPALLAFCAALAGRPHAVEPLRAGENRVVLTMQFVTDQRMAPFKRFVSDMKDAISYFGFREVFGGRRAR